MADNDLPPRSVPAESRFQTDWDMVATAAGGNAPLPLTDEDRAEVEAAAWRYRQEVDREAASDGISFGAIRRHAVQVTKATEKLRTLLADPKARVLFHLPTDELDALHADATRVATLSAEIDQLDRQIACGSRRRDHLALLCAGHVPSRLVVAPRDKIKRSEASSVAGVNCLTCCRIASISPRLDFGPVCEIGLAVL